MVTNKKIQVPIYDFTVYVTIFDEWEEIKKYHKNALEQECTTLKVEESI